jgi:peptide/nickel transport system substrate-binding protein
VMDPATKSPRQARFTDAIEKPEDITAPDKYTVRIVLKEPFAPFLDRTTEGSFSILNRKATEAAGENYARQPVGTGPYKFVQWNSGDRATVERNNDYWGVKPALERIVFRPIPDANTRLIDLESDGVQHILTVPPQEVERLRDEKRVQVQIEPSVNITYLAYHTQKEPFKDNVKLRQAISYAIDRQEILDTIFYGIGLAATSPLTPNSWAFNPNAPRYDFNPAEAKRLYAESGYNGAPIELAVSEGTDTRQMAERIQAQLKEVLGLEVTIKVLEWGGFLSYLREGSHTMFILGWSGGTDPDSILYPLFHTKNHGAAGNRAFYSNPRVDELLLRAQTLTNQAERRQLYLEAQELILQDAPWKTLRHGVNSAGLRPYVKDFQVHPLNRQEFLNTWMDR